MRTNISRFFALFTLIWTICLFTTGCTATWTGEAIQIINLLVPAITAALSILTAFGQGVSPDVLAAVNKWSDEARVDLQNVAGLIDQYNNAEASAQPGILTEIQTALNVVEANLSTLLPEIHVANATTQAKIMAVIEAVQSELVALINLVPALKGEVKSHKEVKALMAAVKSPEEFRDDFNSKAGEFGDQYRI